MSFVRSSEAILEDGDLPDPSCLFVAVIGDIITRVQRARQPRQQVPRLRTIRVRWQRTALCATRYVNGSTLFHRLVGAGKQQLRDRDPQRLAVFRLRTNSNLVGLHRKVAWPLTF